MKFYRLDLRHEYGTSIGYRYFTTKREAKISLKEHMDSLKEKGEGETTEITQIEITPTKKGILAALNKFASRANNG